LPLFDIRAHRLLLAAMNQPTRHPLPEGQPHPPGKSLLQTRNPKIEPRSETPSEEDTDPATPGEKDLLSEFEHYEDDEQDREREKLNRDLQIAGQAEDMAGKKSAKALEKEEGTISSRFLGSCDTKLTQSFHRPGANR
jgi:hypothetical protein